MSPKTAPALTGSQCSVAGAVLAAIRRDVGMTQQGLAEALGYASQTTVQTWEAGRRSMTRLMLDDLEQIRRVLTLAGARSDYLAVWWDALRADQILARILDPGDGPHPLALIVPTRTLTELLGWPITGRAPRQLSGLEARLSAPEDYTHQLAAALRAAANSAGRDESGAMLRRQVHYLVAGHPDSADWLREDVASDVRAVHDLTDWSPLWPLARSQAIVAANNGNPELLERFLTEGLATDRAVRANLAYWTYWVGEIAHPWSADADMLTNQQPWSGELLLPSLLAGMDGAGYRELCATTLYDLLSTRRGLLHEHSSSIATTLERVLSTHTLRPDTRSRLDQLLFATRR